MPTVESRVRDLLKSHTGNESSIDEISSDQSLIELGIDSNTYVKLIVALEVEFGIEFDDDMLDMSEHANIKNLVSYIEGL